MAENLKEIKHESEVKEFDPQAFVSDIDSIMAEREDVASANQSLGNEYKRLEKERGYNMKAVKLMVTLKKMSDENRDAFLTAFHDYADALGFSPKPTLFDKSGADKASRAKAGRRVAEAVN